MPVFPLRFGGGWDRVGKEEKLFFFSFKFKNKTLGCALTIKVGSYFVITKLCSENTF